MTLHASTTATKDTDRDDFIEWQRDDSYSPFSSQDAAEEGMIPRHELL